MNNCSNKCSANSWCGEDFIDGMEDSFEDCYIDDFFEDCYVDYDVQGFSNPCVWNCSIFCIRDYRNVFDYCYGVPTFDTWDCGCCW